MKINATDKQGFSDYFKSNKSNLDTKKISGLDKTQQENMFNEWKSTGSLNKGYFLNQNISNNNSNNSQQSKHIVNGTINQNPIPNTPTVQTPPITQNNSYSLESLNNKFNLGQKAENNIHYDKMNETLAGMKENNQRLSKEQGNIYSDYGKKQSDVVKQYNQEGRDRIAGLDKLAEENTTNSKANVDLRRKDADELMKRQEGIASRQSNMAMGQAGESGLQMSQSTMNDLNNDIISKYGNNIANAEQFKLQTNMSLDEAINKIDSTLIGNKKDNTMMLQNLSDAEKQPIMNALDKALQGDIKAIEDVKTLYNQLSNTKATEEFNRGSEIERLADKQRQWKELSRESKGSLLADDLKEDAWAMDVYWADPSKYEKMGMAEATSTIRKEVANIKRIMDPALVQYLTNKASAKMSGKPFDIIPAYEDMFKAAGGSVIRANQTSVKKDEAMGKTRNDTTDLVNTVNIDNSNYSNIKINKNAPKPNKKQISILDKALEFSGKEKVIQRFKDALHNKNIDETMYSTYINYINSK